METVQTMMSSTRGQYARVSQDMIDASRAARQATGVAFPDWDPGARPWNRSAAFASTGRNKMSMSVDLLRPEGRDILGRLLKEADIFIENNVPETIDKLRLGYEWAKQQNPNIIMVRMPAFGLEGPYTNFRCLGLHVDGVSGHAYVKGYPDEDLSGRGDTVAADAEAGVAGAFAIMTALWHRRRTGKGQMIEMSLAENFIPFMAEPILDYTMNGRVRSSLGNRDTHMAPQGVYPCKGDDNWLTLSVGSDAAWQGLCEVMGNAELALDPRFADGVSRWQHQDELDAIISEWSREQDHRTVFHDLQRHGVAAGPILDELEILDDPHLVERGYYQTLEHPEMPAYKYHGPLWRVGDEPAKLRSHPPLLGEHNEHVYKNIIGVSDEEYARLEAEQHIGMDILSD